MTAAYTPSQVVALDLSLTSTGWACVDGVGTFTSRLRGVDRLIELRGQVVALAGPTVDVVAVEGYAMGSARQSHSYAIGELGGVIRVALAEQGVAIVEVPPSSLKKYATGRGNADKQLVLTEAVRRLGYAGSSNDEADALWLWTMACDALCSTTPVVPAAHRAALNAIDWPNERSAA